VGRVGSLNVASAVAIALAEARRREWESEDDRADQFS
jgi:tRNA (guanosine-2'-O-)-methyltransferase